MPKVKDYRNPVDQASITNYVRVAKNYPLEEGQLVAMVILHFDVPDEKAKEMVEAALKELLNV